MFCWYLAYPSVLNHLLGTVYILRTIVVRMDRRSQYQTKFESLSASQFTFWLTQSEGHMFVLPLENFISVTLKSLNRRLGNLAWLVL